MKFPKLKNKAVLSPMAGITDIAFRHLARKYGAALTYTEFVHSKAILHKNKRTLQMLQTSPLEKPSAVQLFGNSLTDILEAAKILKKFDIIDVNCGCPAYKVIKTGAGSALLNNPDKIYKFISTLTSKINKPITLKIRTGINSKNINAVEIAKKAEKAGASLITIHGRTQKQGYSGKANWDIIKEVKESVNIPVIGNGDIFSPEDFKEKLEYSGVDYIMIARGAISNTYIFTQIKDYLKKGNYKEKNKLEQFQEYLKLAIKYEISFQQIKTHAISFTKGLEKGAIQRNKLSKCKNLEELKSASSFSFNNVII
jgi:nifR3 family TIM-barrel protein